jgi:hypothetical protein
MPFQQLNSSIKPRVGRAVSLGRGHIDPATLTLTLHYQEQVESSGVWSRVEREKVLVAGEHFGLNARDGTITLLDHPFWQEESTWRAGGEYGRMGPLLYKGQVKHPQYVRAEFEYYVPKSVKPGAKVNWDKKNREAKRRLGYAVPEYSVGP